jgi:hypothetical protein
VHGQRVTFARPRVVSQTKWDVALAELREREEAVAAAAHELAAARKRMPWCASPWSTPSRAPTGDGRFPICSTGVVSSSSTGSSSKRASRGGPVAHLEGRFADDVAAYDDGRHAVVAHRAAVPEPLA